MENNNSRFYEFGGFKLDTLRRILLKNDEPIQLSSRIFDLLLVFVQNEGKVLEHEELLDKVWEGTFVEQSNLKKSVSALRQILGENPNESLFIKTVPRRGYCFVAPVRALPDENSIEKIPNLTLTSDVSASKNISENTLKKSFGKAKIIAAVASVCLILTAFGVWKFWISDDNNDDFRLENLKIQKLTTGGNVRQAALSPDGKTIVYATFDNLSRQTLWSKRIGQPNAIQIVEAQNAHYEDIRISPDNNSVYFGLIENKSQEDLFRVPISGGASPRKITENLSSNPTFSPDGKQIAFVRDTADKKRRLIIADAEDGSNEREIYSVPDKHNLIAPVWSPDGKKLVFVSSDVNENGRTWTLLEISPEGGATRPIFPPQKEKVLMAFWENNGNGLIMSAEPKGSRLMQIWRVAYPSGEISRLTNDFSSYDDITLSDDGNSILSVQSDKAGDIWTMNWTMLQNTTRLTELQNITGVFTVLPDGKILAEVIENGQFQLQLFNADGANPQPIFSNTISERAPALMTDKKSFLFISRRSGTQEVWKSDIDGRNLRQLTNEKTFTMFPKTSPDGKEIYFMMYDNAIWRLAKIPSESGKPVYLSDEQVGVFSFSHDGKSIAYSYLDAQQKRWMVAVRNLSDFGLQKQFNIAPISLLEWSPDGKNLIYNASETFRDGGSLWLQPLDGSPPKSLLDTKDDRIFWVEWSPDKQKLYMTRGKTVSNIVLLTKNNQ